MENKVLSIVVPSYNAEKFLHKGIPTFLDERILNDIQVIIVNDGSKDSTPKIADDYKQKYPETITVVHKENGGHGSTINAGIEVAIGKYFCVVDADDWVDTEEFVKLIQYMKNGNSDLYLTHAAKVDPDGKVFGYERTDGLPYGKEILLTNNLDKIKRIEMHNYFIKTRILRENKVKCHEHHFYVDMEYTLYSLMYIKTVTIYDMVVYQYLIGRDGQSVSIESRRRNIKHYYDVVEYLADFYIKKKSEMTTSQNLHYKRRIAGFATGYYSTLLSYRPSKDKTDEIRQFDNWLKNKSGDIYNADENACVQILRKSGFGAYKCCSWIYRWVNRKNIPD